MTREIKWAVSTVSIMCLLAGSLDPCHAVPQSRLKRSDPSLQIDQKLRDLAHHTNSVMLEGMGSIWKKRTGLGFSTLVDVKDQTLLHSLVTSLRLSRVQYHWDGSEKQDFVRMYFRPATPHNNLGDILVEIIYRGHMAYCTGAVVNVRSGLPAAQWRMVPLSPGSAHDFAAILAQVATRAKRHDPSVRYVQGGYS